jgi:hypothetical protein
MITILTHPRRRATDFIHIEATFNFPTCANSGGEKCLALTGMLHLLAALLSNNYTYLCTHLPDMTTFLSTFVQFPGIYMRPQLTAFKLREIYFSLTKLCQRMHFCSETNM